MTDLIKPADRNEQLKPRLLLRKPKPQYLLGVDWDIRNSEVMNAILIDVIGYADILPSASTLTVVSRDFGWLQPFFSSLPSVEASSDPELREKCLVWKLYYMNECPEIPQGAQKVYYKKVGNFGKKLMRLRKDVPHYPSLYNPGDNIVVPPSKSPNINQIPTKYYSQFPSVTYPTVMF